MALLRLTGKHAVGVHAYAIVDDDMLDFLSRWKWKAKPNGSGNHVYAVRNAVVDGKNVTLRMHRVVLGLGKDDPRDADHVNRNALDNRRHNLRPSTRQANCLNTVSVMRRTECKRCGDPVERSVTLSHATVDLICGACDRATRKAGRRSAVCFSKCVECDRDFTARRAGALFCSEACRCRARYRRLRVPSALPASGALRTCDLSLAMKF